MRAEERFCFLSVFASSYFLMILIGTDVNMVAKVNLLGVNFSITDYDQASDIIIDYAVRKTSFAVSALAVHGLVESNRSVSLKEKISKINMVVPDGQPVKWALNFFYKANLKDRVYGPELTVWVLRKANDLGLKVYLYGSTSATLEKFAAFINHQFPAITIVGTHVDRFREATPEEFISDTEKINASGANIVLVGRGCPRQEIWVSDHLNMVHAPMLAVGAAFDFHAGVLKQAPAWMQKNGLEWFFRLIQEPKRLWRRYLITNSIFIYLIVRKMILG